MTTHTHKIRKSAKADSEQLPDVTGQNITYAGGVKANVEVTQRMNEEPTVTAGSTVTVGGYTGIAESMNAEILPQYKLEGAVVWETVTNLLVDGDTV